MKNPLQNEIIQKSLIGKVFGIAAMIAVVIGIFIASANGVFAQQTNFSEDLFIGSRGDNVVTLQNWLISNGYDIPSISSGAANRGYFGSQTKTAVIKYQTEHSVPATGFFGPMTREKLNGQGGGGSSMTNCPSGYVCTPNNYIGGGSGGIIDSGGYTYGSPVISGIDAPTSLVISQVGTWIIRATDPSNASLSYSVTWGDENSYGIYANTQASSASFVQSTTFTHAYANIGVYTVTIVVRNSAGLTAQTSATVQVGTGSASAGSLKIISPNGGEQWRIGTAQTIRWTSPYYFMAAYADLKLVPYQQPCTSQICPMVAQSMLYRMPYTIATNISANQNYYTWLVGNTTVDTSQYYMGTVPAGLYTMQICDAGGSNCDSSDAVFTIN